MKTNLKEPKKRHDVVKFLNETCGDILKDPNFLLWLAKQLAYRPSRLAKLLSNETEEFVSHNALPVKLRTDVYHFWIKKLNTKY